MHQILGSNNKALQQSSNLKKPQEYINNNNGVETTTSIKQKWSKYLNQYNFFFKHNTISTNNNQRCKTKENEMWRIDEVFLSATKNIEQQQGGGVERRGVSRQIWGEGLSCRDSKMRKEGGKEEIRDL
jgi:hypothetical protein